MKFTYIAIIPLITAESVVDNCKKYFADPEIYVPQCQEECDRFADPANGLCKIELPTKGATGSEQLIRCIVNGQPICAAYPDQIKPCLNQVGNPSNADWDKNCKSLCTHYGNAGWRKE